MPNHSRVGMSRAMSQFGEVVHCHKPPYSGIPGEDFVNVRFASQQAADAAYTALKAGQVFVDGFPVGVGPSGGKEGGKGGGGGGKGGGKGHMPIADSSFMARRSESPPRRYARGVAGGNARRRSPPNYQQRGRSPSPPRRDRNRRDRSRSRSRSRGDSRRFQDDRHKEESSAPPPPSRPDRNIRPPRSPSPEPLGPARNSKLVVNPFYRHNRSPSPDAGNNHY